MGRNTAMRKLKSDINADELRRQAEQMAQWLVVHPIQGEVDAPRLLYELQVYQVELEMQNAELRTAAAKTEAALRQAGLLGERLEESARESTASREAAAAAIRAKFDILIKASDEMRISLKVIAEMSQQIRRSGVSDEQAERLDKMDMASQHLSGLIRAAIDLSKREDA